MKKEKNPKQVKQEASQEKKLLTPEQVGQRIKERRTELHLTMEELGRRLGVNKSSIQRYEAFGIDPKKTYMMVSLAEALLTIPEWLTGESDQKEYDTPTKLRRELDEYTEQYIKTVTSSIDGEPRQQLMTTFLGQVMEMYGIICKHFARAMAEADRIATDEGLKESIKLYAIQMGDITENAYRREMYEPLEDMKKIMDVIYHMYDLNRRTPLAETMEIISNAEERLAREDAERQARDGKNGP